MLKLHLQWIKDFLLPVCHPTSKEAEGQEAGMGAKLGQLAPTVQRDIPYHMVSSSVHKLMESCIGAAAQDLMGYQSVGDVHYLFWWLWFFYHHYFPLLMCPIKLPLSQPTDFTFFMPPMYAPSHLRWGAGWVSKRGVYPAGLNHNSPLWHPTRSRAWRVEITVDLTRA